MNRLLLNMPKRAVCTIRNLSVLTVAACALSIAGANFARAEETTHNGTGAAASEHGVAEHGVAEHGGEHAGAEHEGHGALEPINWADFGNKKTPPYLALVINFAILVGLYYFLGKDKVKAALKERKETIAKDIEEAARMKADAEARAEKYQASLKNLARDEADTKSALAAAGAKEKEVLIAGAEEKATRMKRDAEFIVEQETKQMRVEILRETVEDASKSAETLLIAKTTNEDHERLVAEFLKDLGARNTFKTGHSAGAAS